MNHDIWAVTFRRFRRMEPEEVSEKWQVFYTLSSAKIFKIEA